MRTDDAAHASTSDTDSDNASKNIKSKTTSNRKKISLAPAAAGNGANTSTFKTPNATSKIHTAHNPAVKKAAAPIAVKSKYRASVQVGTSSASKSSTRSAFAPASGLDVDLEE